MTHFLDVLHRQSCQFLSTKMRNRLAHGALFVIASSIGQSALQAQPYEPITRERLTDSKGRVFTRREVIRLGDRRFEQAWNGRYRDAINLYSDVLAEDNDRRLMPVHGRKRARVVPLDAALQALDSDIADTCYELNGGGTAVVAKGQHLYANGQECIRGLLIGKPRDRRTIGRRAYRASADGLLRWIHNHRHLYTESPNRTELGEPVIHANFQKQLICLEIDAQQLDGLMARLPNSHCSAIAGHLRLAVETLDHWVMESGND